MSQAEAAKLIYFKYRQVAWTWRRLTGKPVRKFRRLVKGVRRSEGKGKGKHRKGHGRTGGFMWTADDTLAYLKGRGKGHRAGSSGKGLDRTGNPKDRDGNVTKCCICNNEEHFAARCPQKASGKGSSVKGYEGGNPMGSAVFAGGEGDFTEISTGLGGALVKGLSLKPRSQLWRLRYRRRHLRCLRRRLEQRPLRQMTTRTSLRPRTASTSRKPMLR